MVAGKRELQQQVLENSIMSKVPELTAHYGYNLYILQRHLLKVLEVTSFQQCIGQS